MRDLQAGIDLDQEISSYKILILQYGRKSCPPCTSISNRLDDFTNGLDDISSIYIDLDRFPLVAGQREIFSVPTLEIYCEGRLAIKKAGYFSLNDIIKQIKELLFDK